ncbi:MAG: NgoFVII family restriction endonuclease, partial [Candidatus Latescibacteria bacterium]|nr:NgoFVII family restriction endonuclease [Candidatus Latescibacterota bacterium]
MSEINNTNFQLIYHKEDIVISPFDVAITNVAKDNDISVICPYIGINYFNRIASIANSWKLITDVEEWILSHQDEKSRLEIINFIKENKCKIHHIKNVHAKVMLTNQQAIIGSANFTDTGIRNKIEISILIQDEKLNAELNEWFDKIWEKSKDISIEELEKYYNSVKRIYQNNSISDKTYSLSSPKSIKTKLVDLALDNLKIPFNNADHEVEER